MWKQNAISYVAIRISTPPINATSYYYAPFVRMHIMTTPKLTYYYICNGSSDRYR